MTFLELAKFLHKERTRVFGATPFHKPLGSTLAELVDAYSPSMNEEYPNVKASIRQFSRNQLLRDDYSTAEKHALAFRFDYAITVLQFLELCCTEANVRVVTQPDPGIPDEDLIEWALIAPLQIELGFLNTNATEQANIDNLKRQNEGDGQA